jgi:hypothetical protein
VLPEPPAGMSLWGRRAAPKKSPIADEGSTASVFLLDGARFDLHIDRQTTAAAVCIAISDKVRG